MTQARIRAAWLAACAAVCTTAAAQEQIYRRLSPQGTPIYSNEAGAGAELLMSLPAIRVRAAYVADAASGRLQRYPTRTRVPAEPRDANVRSLIAQAARRHGLDTDLLVTLIRHESGFDPMAVSRAGARGLMQLMPQTAKRFGATRLHDPGENIAAGSAYLRLLLDRFGRLDLALAAYNAGEGAVAKYGNRVPPYAETVNYVASILAELRRRKQQP